MLQVLKASFDHQGHIHLMKGSRTPKDREALITILPKKPKAQPALSTAMLSEKALDDWSNPEEDQAWKHLQPKTSSS